MSEGVFLDDEKVSWLFFVETILVNRIVVRKNKFRKGDYVISVEISCGG